MTLEQSTASSKVGSAETAMTGKQNSARNESFLQYTPNGACSTVIFRDLSAIPVPASNFSNAETSDVLQNSDLCDTSKLKAPQIQ